MDIFGKNITPALYNLQGEIQMNSKTLVVYILFNKQHKPFYVGSGNLARVLESKEQRKASHYEIICTVKSKELVLILEAATLLWLEKHHFDDLENKNKPYDLSKLLTKKEPPTFIVTEEWRRKTKQGIEAAKARGVKFGRRKKSD
jgi:hypothetical protein